MGGEHTVNTLKELMDERDKRYQERFQAQEKAISSALIAMDRRMDNTNEWRTVVDKAVNLREGRGLGASVGWGWAVAVISLGLLAFNLFK